jgi:hypothetical protein
MEKQKFINVWIIQICGILKTCIEQKVIYIMKMIPYEEYWENILLHLSKPLSPQNSTIVENFWPLSN